MGTLRSIRPIRIRNTTLKVNEESQMNMYLLTIGTHHFDHLMAMCPHMAITHIQASPVIVITTTVIWQMIEDMSHLEIPIFRKSPKRREIETTNPLGVSTQIAFVHQKSALKIVREKEVIMSEMNQRKKFELAA